MFSIFVINGKVAELENIFERHTAYTCNDPSDASGAILPAKNHEHVKRTKMTCAIEFSSL